MKILHKIKFSFLRPNNIKILCPKTDGIKRNGNFQSDNALSNNRIDNSLEGHCKNLAKISVQAKHNYLAIFTIGSSSTNHSSTNDTFETADQPPDNTGERSCGSYCAVFAPSNSHRPIYRKAAGAVGSDKSGPRVFGYVENTCWRICGDV